MKLSILGDLEYYCEACGKPVDFDEFSELSDDQRYAGKFPTLSGGGFFILEKSCLQRLRMSWRFVNILRETSTLYLVEASDK